MIAMTIRSSTSVKALRHNMEKPTTRWGDSLFASVPNKARELNLKTSQSSVDIVESSSLCTLALYEQLSHQLPDRLTKKTATAQIKSSKIQMFRQPKKNDLGLSISRLLSK